LSTLLQVSLSVSLCLVNKPNRASSYTLNRCQVVVLSEAKTEVASFDLETIQRRAKRCDLCFDDGGEIARFALPRLCVFFAVPYISTYIDL
jgi:hypothetical protein